MTQVSIIGTGNMGKAISTVFRKGGASVELIGNGEDKPVSGEIVVLAVPYPALSDVLNERGDELAGKVVVDITNPVNFETFDSLTVPADASAAHEIAAALPESKVVKAFNTTFASTLAEGTVGDQPTTVLIAGDDADAKTKVADAVKAGGLRAIDAGSLQRARELEALGFLAITLAAQEKITWSGGVSLVN